MKPNKFKCNIPINKIRKDLKNKESQLNFEEQIKILKEEKTTTEKNIIKKSNNLETVNKDKDKDKAKENINPFQIIDPKKLREEYEKIKGNYTESEKRDMVLMELKTTTNYLDIKQENEDKIDIEKVKENEEIKINKKIDNNNENYYEKRLLVLNEMSTKKDYMNKEDIKQSTKQQEQIEILNEKQKNLDAPPCMNITGNSTFQDSKDDNAQFPETDDEFKTEKSKIFNEARTQAHIKYKIFDNLLIKINPINSNLIFPEKYNVDFTHYVFVYENNLKTYPITCIESFKNEKSIKINNLEEPFGLHFCGKKVKLEGEIEIRECAPNNFICKECMEKNKKRYNLHDNYLININGRVSKNIKGKYHCFGTFRKGITFEYCINNFTCKACEILNSCQNYYFE